jgi:diguanylate cyclase (GGDEF)-like protein
MSSSETRVDQVLAPDFKISRGQAGKSPRATDEAAALTRVSAAAADAYRLEDVIEQAAEAARDVTGAAALSISRWDEEGDSMRTLINVGQLGAHEERFPTDETYPLAEYPEVARLLKEGTPYLSFVDDPEAPQQAIDLLRSNGHESEIAVPIVLDGEPWGEVWAASTIGAARFAREDVRFLQAIADRLALVLARAERYTRVSRLAYEDPLTGLANRRAFEERLEALLGPRATLRGPLTLLLCDVDGLKDINDVHGHYAGDRALCRVAESLELAAAPVSAALVGRLAGDEFCLLLEGADPSVASDVAASVMERLATEHDPPLSVSLGAATASDGMAPADLLRAADRAQYAAKRRGGGRLCTAEAESLSDALAGPVQNNQRGADQRLERAASDALGMLDAGLAGSPVIERIEAVAGMISSALNGAAWSISRWEQGSPVMRTVASADDRASRLRATRVMLEHHTWPLTSLPLAADLLTRGNGGFVIRSDDERAEPITRDVIRDLGYQAALVTTVRHGGGSYLVTLLADSHSGDLAPAAVRVQLLLRVAAAAPVAS